LPGQHVALSPDRFSMDDMSRLWGLLPDEPLRTSIVYLATPVFVELRDSARYPPVTSRRMDTGLAAEPPRSQDRNAA
jgi:hypothetical protein